MPKNDFSPLLLYATEVTFEYTASAVAFVEYGYLLVKLCENVRVEKPPLTVTVVVW